MPACAQGSSVPVMENAVFGVFLGFLVSSWCLVHMESTSLAGLLVVYKTWVTKVCLLLDRGRWRHYLCNRGEYFKVHKNCLQVFWDVCWIHELGAIHAGLSGTAQSPWL